MCTVDISTINVIVHIKTPPKRNEVKNIILFVLSINYLNKNKKQL